MKKRICAVIMCLLLAVNLVGVPKANAVVLEGSYLGSVFGTVFSSLGYSWASENMGNTQFGEAIYSLMTDWASEKSDDVQTYLNNLADWVSTGLVVAGQGKLQLSYNIMNLATDFAQWLQSKFSIPDSSTDTSIPVYDMTGYKLKDGSLVLIPSLHTSSSPDATRAIVNNGTHFSFNTTYQAQNHSFSVQNTGKTYTFVFDDEVVSSVTLPDSNSYIYPFYGFATINGYTRMSVCGTDSKGFDSYVTDLTWILSDKISGLSRDCVEEIFGTKSSANLKVENPDIHYPTVAEDGSQVYEITVDGVTATDIEGIIQGAVDQILAGTAAIAGEVVQAQDVPVTPEAPAAGEYAVPGLETIFPFCIPFDIYAFCSALNADPVAPSFEWRMQYAPLGLDYTFEIDLSAFDSVAQVLRTMELLAFCVGLAFWTRHLIRG